MEYMELAYSERGVEDSDPEATLPSFPILKLMMANTQTTA
jgi:hypothetical protein